MTDMPRKEYPRPQFVRADWVNLNGPWTYEFDFGKSGAERGLQNSKGFADTIIVPFCPESRLSGVAHTDFIEQMFYHRKITVPANWAGKRILLHFGGVDYRAEGFVNGKSIGIHFGGSCSFEFDLTGFVTAGEEFDFVLMVTDELRRGVQMVGKQCFGYKSAGCSYTRTTGIWQTVWLEGVAKKGLRSVEIRPDLDNASFNFTPILYQDASDLNLKITVKADGKVCGEVKTTARPGRSITVPLDKVRAWCPEDPFLYDIEYTLTDRDGNVVDFVTAYAGLRKIHCENGKVYLNNKPIFLRLVLDQGFYPEGVWTAPGDADLKRDIELSMAAGFNGARLHQKVFEERFHYWADKLGYLTWGESSSWGMMTFSGGDAHTREYWEAIYDFQQEWRRIIERDRNHPSIIAWTPLNETGCNGDWDTFRRAERDIYDLTKQLDPTRPCNETSGYHHAKTDLWTVHLYRPNVEELEKALHPEGPGSCHIADGEEGFRKELPYLNDEWGGFLFIGPDRAKFADNTWGYHGLAPKTEDELCALIRQQAEYMNSDPSLAGWCYTQLTDVEQEQNGVYYYDRTPKVSEGKLKAAFTAKK